MDETKSGDACHMCEGHDCYTCGYHQRHLLLRWLLGLLIIVLVFWIGFKLGEFKGAYIDGYYGSPKMMMLPAGNFPVTYFRTGGMMGGNQMYNSQGAPTMQWQTQSPVPQSGATQSSPAK